MDIYYESNIKCLKVIYMLQVCKYYLGIINEFIALSWGTTHPKHNLEYKLHKSAINSW